jgi:hypothetical protein
MLHQYTKLKEVTINHVFIIEDDILEVKLTTTKEKLQSINVGISRVYRAYIYNKIYKVDNSNLDKKITSNGCTMKDSLIFARAPR